MALCVGYAVLRYNVLAGVPWAELPLFVANKGVSLAAVALIGASYLVSRVRSPGPGGGENRRSLARTAGLSGFALAVAHVLITLVVFSRDAYPRLFDGADLSPVGWAGLVSGALATPLFALPAIYSFPRLVAKLDLHHWKRAQHLGYSGLAITALHVLSIGGHNWTAFSAWPGGLPPISLLSFVACVLPLVAKAQSLAAGCRVRVHFAVRGDAAMRVPE